MPNNTNFPQGPKKLSNIKILHPTFHYDELSHGNWDLRVCVNISFMNTPRISLFWTHVASISIGITLSFA